MKKWLGIADLEARGLGERTTIWRKYKRGEFPAPKYLGTRRVWDIDDIEAWERKQIRPRAESPKK